MTSRLLLAGALLAALACVLIWRFSAVVERGRAAASTFAAAQEPAPAPEPELVAAAPLPVAASSSRTREPARTASKDEVVWYGRVLDALDGAPIAGATLRLREPGKVGPKPAGGAGKKRGRIQRPVVHTFESTADGRFPPIPVSGRATTNMLDHPLYGSCAVALAPGHGSPAEECVLRLTRVATLEVRVRDARAVPLDAFVVEVRAAPSSALGAAANDARRRTGPSDVGGRCVLAGLPAQRPLALQLLRHDQPVRVWPAPLVLAPGETRVLDWLVGDGCRVTGVVLDPEQRPLSDVEVHLAGVAAEGDGHDEHDEVELGQWDTTTMPDGSFFFEDVPAGRFELGLKPSRLDWVLPRTELVVSDEDVERECALHVQHALAIHGTVLGPLGHPLARVTIQARGLDAEWGTSATSTKGGRFELAPLLAGAYALRLEAPGSRPLTVAPRELVCAAGDEGVVLCFAAGGALAGRVVAGGRGVRARVTLCALQPPSPETHRRTTDELGVFEFGNLAPGTYELAACDERGFALLTGLEVTALRLVEDVELALEPAARLVLALAADARDALEFELWSGTHLVALGALAPGQTLACAGPPGPFRCRLRAGADAWEQGFEAAAGAEPQRVELAVRR